MKRKSLTAVAIAIGLTALTACGEQAETVSNMTETGIETTIETAETETEPETTEPETETETETEPETTEPVETVETTETVETETVTEITEITEITEVETTAKNEFIVEPVSKSLYATCRLNARRGPGTEYDIIGSYEIGEAILIAGKTQDTGGKDWYQTADGLYISANLVSETPPTIVSGVPDVSKGEINPDGIPITDESGAIIGYDNSPAATGEVIINPETGLPAQPGDTWSKTWGDPDVPITYGGTLEDRSSRSGLLD